MAGAPKIASKEQAEEAVESALKCLLQDKAQADISSTLSISLQEKAPSDQTFSRFMAGLFITMRCP